MADDSAPETALDERQARLLDSYNKASAADDPAQWIPFYQALAGTSLIVALETREGDKVAPRTIAYEGSTTVLAFADMQVFAAALTTPTDYVELDGAELCGLLQGQDTPLLVHLDQHHPAMMISTEAQDWIAQTFGAEVTRRATEGVSVAAPDLPDLPLMQALGEAVGALGGDCPEAWLVSLTSAETEPELVLVLGLSDQATRMETEIAETVTRSIQAVTDHRFAVACPGRGSALMASARKHGIGIGGG